MNLIQKESIYCRKIKQDGIKKKQTGMVIAIIVAFVVVIHVQCLVSVYLSLVKIKYSVCV